MVDSKISTTNKQRVLMVHNYYQIGGGEHTVYENEQRLLKDHGHFVATYTRDNKEIKESLWKKMILPFTTLYSFKTYRDVKKIIKTQKIDVVHCHNTFPLISPSVYYAAWKCGVPVIQTIHNFRFLCANGVLFRDGEICEECLRRGIKCGVKHKCYRGSRLQSSVLVNMLRFHRRKGTYKRLRYIFLTEFNKDKFRGLLGDKLDSQYVKPNFEFISDECSDSPRDGSYVFIGRLDKNKGIDFVVDNWSSDRDLYIFGSGELEEYVKSACERNNCIHYLGFQPKKAIREYLKKATAMVFPTDLYEGFPMTLIEAFSCGTPIICSDIGNGADIVRSERAGVSYTRRERASFFHAMQDVEENFSYYSSNARSAYINKYNPESNYKQLISIYEDILR